MAEGYVKNQGFYVYREKRLIIHGTWFGLIRQGELTKLTRVRIDMGNDLDAEWRIDVRKASAQLPYQVRDRLRTVTERIVGTSKKVYTGRATKLVSDTRLPVWQAFRDKDRILYRVNYEHPLMDRLSSRLGDEERQDLEALIELVEVSLPVDSMFADYAGHPERFKQQVEVSDSSLRVNLEAIVTRLERDGGDPVALREMLKKLEPYKSNWHSTETILSELVTEGVEN
jgi:hypothetical protein